MAKKNTNQLQIITKALEESNVSLLIAHKNLSKKLATTTNKLVRTMSKRRETEEAKEYFGELLQDFNMLVHLAKSLDARGVTSALGNIARYKKDMEDKNKPVQGTFDFGEWFEREV